MIGLGELLLSYLRRQIGLRTDSNNASGSIHAKLGDLKDYLSTTIIDNIMTRMPKLSTGRYEYDSGTLYTGVSRPVETVFSLSNKAGKVYKIGSNGGSKGYDCYYSLYIYVDGVLYLSKIDVPQNATWDETATFDFKNSFEIQVDLPDECAGCGGPCIHVKFYAIYSTE